MDTLDALISPATRWFTPEEPLRLESGQRLLDVHVAWRSWGRLNAAGDNAVLVNHALTGSADVDAWWPGLLGPGRALDPDRDFVVCANLLGSCYGTTGPTSIDPYTGRAYGGAFPAVTVRDMVRLQKRLVDHLGIRRLALVIGGSLGGMLTLEWALRYPELAAAIVPVATAARQPPWAIGFSEAQRQALFADPLWRDGGYAPARPPHRGLAAARAIAMLSYRHWSGFGTRFGRDRADERFQVERYLRHQGNKFARRFDAASYVTLTRAMDAFDAGDGRGGAARAMQAVAAPALVVSVDSDILYPVEEQIFIAGRLRNSEHVVLRSPHGHDGFLLATEQLNSYVRDFRRRRSRASATEPAACGG